MRLTLSVVFNYCKLRMLAVYFVQEDMWRVEVKELIAWGERSEPHWYSHEGMLHFSNYRFKLFKGYTMKTLC